MDRVAYIATQDSPTEAELYLVEVDAPGVSSKLNSALPVGGAVVSVAFSPDGQSIAYVADADVAGQPELYLVDVAAPGTSVKLNDALQAAGGVRADFAFSPDGTQVLYSADRDADEIYQLFLVDVTAPAAPVTVNPTLVANGSVSEGYRFSPDGEWIGYLADQDTNEVFELYGVETDMPGSSFKLNGPLAAEGDLCNFIFDPTSTRVAYCAEEETNDVIDLFVVELSAPAISTKLNPTLVAGGRVTSYEFGPNGDFIVYRADQDTNDVFEIYDVELSSGVSTKLNAALVAGGNVDLPVIEHRPSFLVTPDGLSVIYAADQDTDQQFELYSVARAAAGASSKLTPPLMGRGVDQFALTDDGAEVVYQALQDSGAPRLYRVEVMTPGVSIELSDTFVENGSLSDFGIAPGFRLID
jgi:Tol biopolymer transport system component